MVRVSLQTLALLVAVFAVAAAVIAHCFFRLGSITTISSRSDWDAATKSGRCIAFVDGGWNMEVVAFRKPFGKFAEWCNTNSTARALTMTIDANDNKNDVWKICEELWRKNSIHPGGLKNFGGAGRIVWIDNGRVVDFEWCTELMNLNDLENINALKARTGNAFK